MSETRTKRRKRRKVFTKSYDEDELDDAAVNAELRAFGFFVEDEPADDAERWGYDLQSKITCERFNEHFGQLVERLEGKDYNAEYFHRRGFKSPIHFAKSDGLGLVMPSAKDFTVQDVKKLVGANRIIDVVDVKTQKGSQMTLREFVDYFQSPDRKRLLNVLSLEFSRTKLAEYVQAPAAIKSLDWVELAWPQCLRDQQTDSTNTLNSMKYPKVQNYCLMSVGNCYTDFHVDFGGTSVWYHVLRGEKIFWLIPPTEENCQHFQAWTLSGRQHKTFFGDLVEQCVRVRLKTGDTFMIPSGWFHAVYTPVDSLVFGGNFLHSFAIPMQLSVYEIERNTHVPTKFRYPFFLEMQWYVLERYYSILTGRTFLRRMDDEDGASTSGNAIVDSDVDDEEKVRVIIENATQLTDAELEGLNALVNWLQSLASSKRRVPELIERPDTLLRKFRKLLPLLKTMQRHPSSAQFSVLSIGRSRQTKVSQSSDQQSMVKSAVQQKRPKLEDANLRPQTSTSTSISAYSKNTPVPSSTISEPSSLAIPKIFAATKSERTLCGPTTTSAASNMKQDLARNRSVKDELEDRKLMPPPMEFVIVPGDSVPIIGAECTIE